MTTDSRLPLLLWGPMGVGKSTVGARVAAALGRPFVDLDRAVEISAGASVSEIFANGGEARFRKLERDALLAVLEARPSPVVALGGGSLVDPDSRALAVERGVVVGLSAPITTLAERLSGSSSRPLLDGSNEELTRKLASIVDDRASAYAAAHVSIGTDERSVDEVVHQVVLASQDRYVPVTVPTGPYAVRITSKPWEALVAILGELTPSSVFLVIDETVEALHGAAVRSALAARGIPVRGEIRFPSGEEHKELQEVERALGELVASGADRRSVLVAIGGGVTTDMGGFAAALFARGIRWVAVPTTLLSMVDASVGGKTGVDFRGGKNLIGAFHQPSGVVVGPELTRTETPRGFRSGLAELVKSLALGDVASFEECELAIEDHRGSPESLWTPERLSRAVTAGIRVKASIVARDPYEKGRRAVLNFGHTLGHALESLGNLTETTHGEAVAMGMVAACRIGEALGVTPRATTLRITAILEALGLPTMPPEGHLAEALPWVSKDKKRTASSIRFVLLRELGEPSLVQLSLEELTTLVSKVFA